MTNGFGVKLKRGDGPTIPYDVEDIKEAEGFDNVDWRQKTFIGTVVAISAAELKAEDLRLGSRKKFRITMAENIVDDFECEIIGLAYHTEGYAFDREKINVTWRRVV